MRAHVIYIHAYIITYIHECMHTYIHTYIHTWPIVVGWHRSKLDPELIAQVRQLNEAEKLNWHHLGESEARAKLPLPMKEFPCPNAKPYACICNLCVRWYVCMCSKVAAAFSRLNVKFSASFMCVYGMCMWETCRCRWWSCVIYACVCMCLCVYVCMYVCMHVCMYMYVWRTYVYAVIYA